MTSKQQQILIIRAYQATDNPRVKQRLLELMWPLVDNFVYSTLIRLKINKEDRPDLVQHCFFTVAERMEKFDSSTGLAFISYLVWWLRATVQKYQKESEFIRPKSGRLEIRDPRNRHELITKRALIKNQIHSIDKKVKTNGVETDNYFVDTIREPTESQDFEYLIEKIESGKIKLNKNQMTGLKCKLYAERFGIGKNEWYAQNYKTASACRGQARLAIESIRKQLKKDISICNN